MNPFNYTIDFLLNLPPPTILSQHILPWLSKNGFVSSQTFIDNIHTAIYVALFYQLCFLVANNIIFPPLASLTASQKRSKLVNQSAVHFVSVVQTIIVLKLSFDNLLSDQYHARFSEPASRIFGVDRETMAVATFALGYFIWDIYISMIYSTFPFFVHAVVSTIVFCIGMKPYIQYYGCVFLMFELSNPFLNIRWFGMKYLSGSNDSKVSRWIQLINNLCLMIVFFLARIVWGWWQIKNLAYDFWLVRHDPRFLLGESLAILAGNFVLDILNVVWFSTMCKVAVKTIRKGAK
ncbi:hypothetical protein ZYGR_0I05320 [Zygosaccharomyces rouxii]|uniref:ZYRO0C12584p n=2 Tax=Zygosaccharomyces rouxii TaxID=4956 RepID=C5DTZ7_ZYGRC|nr:uncharacterized protein ZYRO0C12584g [Zygosaccharomyces rouxii]KAH9201566.1 TLC domain-containing protein [Zygosaccharomyces rouxii]GAV48235.1 hypothetical protein ZYGR_0I05320 [Zygosaccharomyces rouxii]CAR27258.1 ZYRO0C12584p [Zygosaccharomyces rouxii]